MKILFGFTFTSILVCISCNTYLENVNCGSHVDYIPTDPGTYKYDPMYVKLHRCHGKYYEANPHNRRCVPKPDGIVFLNITMFNRGGNAFTKRVENHTACIQECAISQKNCTPYQTFNSRECDCICNKTAKAVCPSNLQWDPIKCDCTCQKQAVADCGLNKEWSETECGCTCKADIVRLCNSERRSINKDSCLCDDAPIIAAQSSGCEGGVNGAMLAVIILGEAFIIVVCYYFFYIYCYKHNYLGRKAEKVNNSGYYHKGDISSDTRVMNGGTYHTANYDDDYNLNERSLSDKERIRHEEANANNVNAYPMRGGDNQSYRSRDDNKYPYYPNTRDDEKAPLSKQGEEFYMYNDIMEVDGRPPSSTDTHNLNIPPDYSDCVSDVTSEDGYASVTQV